MKQKLTEQKEKEQEFIDLAGKIIRACRKAKGYSIQKLADECEVDYSQISRVERGAVNCTFATLSKISNALETDAGELLPKYIKPRQKKP